LTRATFSVAVWTVIVAAFGLSSPAFAQKQIFKDPKEFKEGTAAAKFFSSKSFYETVGKYAFDFDRMFGINCEDQYSVRDLQFFVEKPIVFEKKGGPPVGGTWSVKFTANRCKNAKIYNLRMAAQKDGKLDISLLIPGTSIASASLQHDASKMVHEAADYSGYLPDDCKEKFLFDTKVTKTPGRQVIQGRVFENAWIENWTVRGCGVDVVVPIMFAPDPDLGATRFGVGKAFVEKK
jgi:hypothetical protein